MSNRTPRAAGPSAGSTTRVALRIAGGPGPAFIAAAVEQLVRVEGIELVLALIVPDASAPSRRGAPRWLLEGIYERLERAIFRAGPLALAEVPAVALPNTVERVHGGTLAEQSRALHDARADVLVDLAGDEADGLPMPRHGRWRLRFSTGEGGRRQARLGRPTTALDLAEAVLAIDLPDGTAVEVCHAVGALHRIGFHRTRDAAYWRSSAFAARKLARLAAGDRVSDWHDIAPAVPPSRVPSVATNRSSAPPFIELLRVTAARVLERVFFTTSWMVMVRGREPGDGPPADLRGFRPLAAPAGRFYADPFVVHDGPRTRLFVEDCPVGRHRGRISSLTLEPDGRWTGARVVLDDLPHRAYPYVVQTSRGLLMTPDSGRAGGIDIFRLADPGGGLVRAGRCLDDVAVSDPCLLEHDGRFWLFAAVTGHGMSPWDELHLFSAADLDGPWQAHPSNPVVADVRRARPAGRIFAAGGTLVRPGQDCSAAYGRRIVLSEITTLSETDYEERPIGSIEPRGLAGVERTHTYGVDGPIEALDGYRRRFRFRPAARAAS